MENKLQNLLEVDEGDYSKLFSTVQHDITCHNVPPASIRLTYIRHNAGGLIDLSLLVNTLITYITHFCFSSERRKGLDEKARNRTFMEAKELFRKDPRTGQPGELLVYFLIEAVLRAPQVLKKMLITTNANDERKGSDGVHVRWIDNQAKLELIFAESKLHKDFAAGLKSAFESIAAFHSSASRHLEIQFFLNAFTLLDLAQQALIRAYVEGENKGNCQEVHVCLVGHSWSEYRCLDDEQRSAFIAEFDQRYLTWAKKVMRSKLTAHLENAVKHIRFEFFFLPFVSVETFRDLFLESL